MSKFLLVDGNNLTMRAMHGTRPLYDAMGNPTNCLFTSIRSLIRACADLKPHYVLWFWDKGRSEYRKQIYPEYKFKVISESEESKLFYADWKYQIQLLDEYLPILGVHPLSIDGMEADDLINMTAKMLRHYTTVIVSSDQAFFQLVDRNCQVYSLHRQMIYTKRDVQNEYGVSPSQWVEYRALTGDASDNIAGVPGVGPVRAQEFVSRVVSVLDWLDSPKIEKPYDEKILESKLVVLRNVQLMDLSKIPMSLEAVTSVESQILRSVDAIPSKTRFWEVCLRHQMSTLLEHSHLWPAVFGAKNDTACQ